MQNMGLVTNSMPLLNDLASVTEVKGSLKVTSSFWLFWSILQEGADAHLLSGWPVSSSVFSPISEESLPQQPQTMMHPPPCFTVVFLGTALFSLQTGVWFQMRNVFWLKLSRGNKDGFYGIGAALSCWRRTRTPVLVLGLISSCCRSPQTHCCSGAMQKVQEGGGQTTARFTLLQTNDKLCVFIIIIVILCVIIW